jgi:cyclin H
MSKQEFDQLYEQLLSYVRASRLTDAELLYPPSQIALACVGLVEPDLANRWAQSKSSEAVLVVLESIKAIISEESVLPDVETVREVDRRLKLCKNPEKIVGSKSYLAKKAEEEKLAMDKRNKKADEIRQTIEEGDPFGNELATERAMLDDDDD